MLSFAIRPGKILRLPLLVASWSILVFSGCSTLVSTIADSSSQGTTTPVAAPTQPPASPITTGPVPKPTPAPIPPPTPGQPTTLSPQLNASSIFIGASIVRRWQLPVHNAGVSGQTSSQVLERFSTDVLHQGYARVIVQVGSNDILQRVKDPPSTVAANVSSMAQQASADHMVMYVISLGPITSNGQNLDASAKAVNAALMEAAGAQGFTYVDIFTALQGHPEYFLDGLHPNEAGYAVIEELLARVLTK
jgi:hypothetical protein